MRDKNNGNPWALLPIGVFLAIFLGAGILSGDFYTMPAIVGFLIALAVAFCQNRKVIFQKKLAIISKGIGEENIVTMCLIFLAAGAFSGTISAAGGVESTVNLGLSIMPPSIAVTGLFIIGCFISVSMELRWEPLQPWRLSGSVLRRRPAWERRSVWARWYAAPCSAIICP